MSLDTPRNHRHASMLEDDDHPGWELDLIRERQAADRAAEKEWLEREAIESVEARESYWAGVFARVPEHLKRVVYRDVG